MSLQLSLETNTIYGNDKPDLGGSGLLGGLDRTGDSKDVSIISIRPNFDKGRMINHGFRALPISFFQSCAWTGASIKYKAFIVELLIRCAWKETQLMINGHIIVVKKGQFVCSTRRMAQVFSPTKTDGTPQEGGFTRDDIRGAIRFFEKLKILHQEVLHQHTIITITDKDIYDTTFNFIPPVIPPVVPQSSPSHLNIQVNKVQESIVSKDTLAKSAKKRLRQIDPLKYSFESGCFEGITDKDREDWKLAYPCIDISSQIAASIQWIKCNPSRVHGRSLWRKFLTGWLARNNEKAVNRQAYSSQNGKPTTDRRQKNSDGSLANGGEDWF